MNILITGIPAVGKTIIAKQFKEFGFKVYSDKDFVNKKNSNIVKEYNHKMKDINLLEYSKTINSKLGLNTKKISKSQNIVLEGILFPYCLDKLKIKLDYIFILSLEEKKLRLRYKKRKYPEAKIMDNLFVQDNNLLYKTILEKANNKNLPIIAEIPLKGKEIDITSIIELICSTFSYL